jgi:hypothetical protein
VPSLGPLKCDGMGRESYAKCTPHKLRVYSACARVNIRDLCFIRLDDGAASLAKYYIHFFISAMQNFGSSRRGASGETLGTLGPGVN